MIEEVYLNEGDVPEEDRWHGPYCQCAECYPDPYGVEGEDFIIDGQYKYILANSEDPEPTFWEAVLGIAIVLIIAAILLAV